MIVNVQRGGPGLGNISPAQGDYFQATRGGGNGDYHNIVLAPASVQEMLDFTFQAFDLADQYRTPVLVLSDGRLGQMMEPVELRDPPAKKRVEKPWALTGAKGRDPHFLCSFSCRRRSLPTTTENCRRSIGRSNGANARAESYRTDDARNWCSWPTGPVRLCREAADILRDEGLKVGLFRPITLWPFPSEEAARGLKNAKQIVVVEVSAGQLIQDVRLTASDRLPIEFVGYMGGEAPSVKELVALGESCCRSRAARPLPRKTLMSQPRKKYLPGRRVLGPTHHALLPRLRPRHRPSPGGRSDRPLRHPRADRLRRRRWGARCWPISTSDIDMSEAAHGRVPAVATGVKRAQARSVRDDLSGRRRPGGHRHGRNRPRGQSGREHLGRSSSTTRSTA